ncbi:MAG: hypothetical protein HYW24_01985 [Candidatus Aenigmarchaeota archaeon]|nr:hypothetical protein [Candidatus Aenigmarchaeota archaeon]
MNLRKLPISSMSYEIEQPGPTVALVCPTCSNEVNLQEIFEDNGKVRCVNCI